VVRGSFVTDRIGLIEMSAERSQDIDNLQDFEQCEALLQQQHSQDAS
jgi:CMP-N-acetylneuraminic acid synthetase